MTKYFFNGFYHYLTLNFSKRYLFISCQCVETKNIMQKKKKKGEMTSVICQQRRIISPNIWCLLFLNRFPRPCCAGLLGFVVRLASAPPIQFLCSESPQINWPPYSDPQEHQNRLYKFKKQIPTQTTQKKKKIIIIILELAPLPILASKIFDDKFKESLRC